MKHEIVIGRQRKRRGWRVRNRIKRDSVRLRLSVFRSHKHVYAQLIDDQNGRTVAVASTLDKDVREKVGYGGNKAAAQVVGQVIAQRALAAGVTQAAFDRREYKYHGRVAALADAARDAGLDLGAKAPEPVVVEKPKEKEKKKGAAKPKAPKAQ
ncbi:MAG: 50S ribosomal protein L18 [Pirellulales bacterium]|nr:50S ribosomal protein L18 [Pirellulales bacterium]